MASNNYSKLSDAQLADFVAQAAAVFAPVPATYGLTAQQVTKLTSAGTDLAAGITAADAAEAAFHAAIQGKLADRQEALDEISICAGLMYATPTITPEQIAAAGFQPRDTTRTPIIPTVPLDLVATPNANGTVKLAWSRNGNPYAVTFVIEESTEGVAWAIAGLTSKRTITLDGYAPGVKKWFRVKASHRDVSSIWSSVVTIYDSGEQVQLQLAA
jgi:hypothetical protein